MLENNLSENQLLHNLRNLQPQRHLNIIQTLSNEITLYQSFLAYTLELNTHLVDRANSFAPNPLSLQQLGFCQTQLSHSTSQNNEVKLEEKDQQFQEMNQFDIKNEKLKNNEIAVKKQELSQIENCHDKNETKNIPKNYGKAILSFIQKNFQKHLTVIKPILQKEKMNTSDLLNHIKKHKKEVNSINYLKLMWGHQNDKDPIFKCIRILSYTFMRKHCLSYIFNSRVKNYATHIKYRRRIIEGIENPAEFTCIKQF